MNIAAMPSFNTDVLADYLSTRIDQATGIPTLQRIGGGYSNPTFLLAFEGGADLVLRKRPSGKLLPSAHAIDREYRVMKALEKTGIPVPQCLLYCDDASIIGTHFYIMQRLEGRAIHDNALPGFWPSERAAIFDSMNKTLTDLHRIDPGSVGLGDFGRNEGFVERQISRWWKQYEKGMTRKVSEFEQLRDWLCANMPVDAAEVTIVHGDYRLGNLMLHPREPRVIAVLDWELATLGHPLADLGYNLMAWIMHKSEHEGLAGHNLAALGIPSRQDYVRDYLRRRSIEQEFDPFWIALAFYRLSAIFEGIVSRAIAAGKPENELIEVRRYGPIFARHGLTIAGE